MTFRYFLYKILLRVHFYLCIFLTKCLLKFAHDFRIICCELQTKPAISKEKIGGDFMDLAISDLRKIHLLVEMHNDAMRSAFFFLAFTCGMAQIVSSVVLVRPEPLPFLVTFFFTAMTLETSLVILVVYGFAGDVHKTSTVSLLKLKQIIRSVCHGNCKKERKYLGCFLAYCQTAKIRFGLSNFIEKSTSLIFQLFCVQHMIDLL